uniref:Uncharacterized protein n=1 Tax=Rhizophagus irregularis (strain DAOM 181602 / DAOM 197198 / MUCL 43194) TaxID=747089 RepID=U9UCA4_RHIID
MNLMFKKGTNETWLKTMTNEIIPEIVSSIDFHFNMFLKNLFYGSFILLKEQILLDVCFIKYHELNVIVVKTIDISSLIALIKSLSFLILSFFSTTKFVSIIKILVVERNRNFIMFYVTDVNIEINSILTSLDIYNVDKDDDINNNDEIDNNDDYNNNDNSNDDINNNNYNDVIL